MTLLSLNNLSFTIPGVERPIIDDLSLALHPNDFLVVLGGNGSGKSSLIKLINGLYKAGSGSITLSNKHLNDKSLEHISKEIATLTQNLQMSTFGDLSVAENYLLAAMKKSSSPPNIDDLTHYHPALDQKLDTPVKNLSGGERQCLALAMCLLHPPKLLLLDEHTSALDPKIGKEIMEKTYTLTNGRVTTLMATHRLDDALAYGNRLIVMKEGKIAHEFDEEAKRSLSKDNLLRLY